MPEGAIILFTNLVLWSDREGRLNADPKWINKRFCSFKDYTDKEVETWLLLMHKSRKNGHGLIELYEVEGYKYLWLPGLEGEQGQSWRKERESPSDIPPPPLEVVAEFITGDAETDSLLEPELAKIVQIYRDYFGEPSPSIFGRLKDAHSTYPVEWYEKAVSITKEANVRNFKYTEAILERWHKQGAPDNGYTGKGKRDTTKSSTLKDETKTEL